MPGPKRAGSPARRRPRARSPAASRSPRHAHLRLRRTRRPVPQDAGPPVRRTPAPPGWRGRAGRRCRGPPEVTPPCLRRAGPQTRSRRVTGLRCRARSTCRSPGGAHGVEVHLPHCREPKRAEPAQCCSMAQRIARSALPESRHSRWEPLGPTPSWLLRGRQTSLAWPGAPPGCPRAWERRRLRRLRPDYLSERRCRRGPLPAGPRPALLRLRARAQRSGARRGRLCRGPKRPLHVRPGLMPEHGGKRSVRVHCLNHHGRRVAPPCGPSGGRRAHPPAPAARAPLRPCRLPTTTFGKKRGSGRALRGRARPPQRLPTSASRPLWGGPGTPARATGPAGDAALRRWAASRPAHALRLRRRAHRSGRTQTRRRPPPPEPQPGKQQRAERTPAGSPRGLMRGSTCPSRAVDKRTAVQGGAACNRCAAAGLGWPASALQRPEGMPEGPLPLAITRRAAGARAGAGKVSSFRGVRRTFRPVGGSRARAEENASAIRSLPKRPQRAATILSATAPATKRRK